MSQRKTAWMSIWIKANLARSGRMGCSLVAISALTLGAASVQAETDPQVAKALSFKPRQPNVPYDVVAASDVEKCTSRYEKRDGVDGLSIYNADGQLLRRFNDLNGDRQVDQWCYFKDGIEVYRDIDSDFNATADQSRWLGTNGTRWALDKNEDGVIDSWKIISPEEVTIEAVEAIRTKNTDRFKALVMTQSEIENLGLGNDKTERLKERVSETVKAFVDFARTQKLVSNGTKWAHFAADKPGIVPSGTDGATKDITVYENVIAIIDNDGTSQQLQVGTMVQLGNIWKLVDCPRFITEGNSVTESGFFFPSVAANRMGNSGTSGGLPAAQQALLMDLEKFDSEIQSNPPEAKLAKLHDSRAETLVKLIDNTQGTNDMELWVRQLVDSVSSAVMMGQFPNGMQVLKNLGADLQTKQGGKNMVPYVVYRTLTTDFQLESSQPNANYSRLQDKFLEKLEEFANTYPESPETADAMIQIALSYELAANEADAKKWYERTSTNFPETNEGKKARGALNRLSLAGRKFALAGKTLDGKSIETARLGGRPIVVHYWASWCQPCKKDMETMQKLLERRPNSFYVLGINLDEDADKAKASLRETNTSWQHIHDSKGFVSDLAVGLGVSSVPVTILIDKDGVVSMCAAHFSSEMENALEELLANGTRGNAASNNAKSNNPAPKIPANAKVGSGQNQPPAKNAQQPQRPSPKK